MALTNEEKQVLDWLSEKKNEGTYRIKWEEFQDKVREITGEDIEDLNEDRFQFNLHGVTVTEEGYPIRDLEQGITRGYSAD